MLSSMFSHVVRITQNPGQPSEAIHDGVRASLQPKSCFFPLEPRLRKGDRLEADYFDGPVYVLAVQRHEMPGSGLSHQEVQVGTQVDLTPKSEVRPTVATTQVFHGAVGVVAAGETRISGVESALARGSGMSQSRQPTGRIFLSHASNDKDLVSALVDCLRLGIPGLNPDMIFCTSLEGMRIPDGEDFLTFIKGQLQSPSLVVFVITPNYYDSLFCMCELGATWAMSHGSFPILVPPLTYDNLKAVIEKTQARHLDAAGLNALRDRLVAALGLPASATSSTSLWEEQRNAFLKKLPDLLKDLKPTVRVPRSELIEASEKIKEIQAELETERATSAQRARELEVVSGLKDKAEVAEAMRSAAPDATASLKESIAVFEKLRMDARASLRNLPGVAQLALFKEYAGGVLFISNNWSEDELRGEAIAAAERDFIKFDDGRVRTNTSDPLTQKAIRAIDALFDHIDCGPKGLVEWIGEEYSLNPSRSNRRFWEELLSLPK